MFRGGLENSFVGIRDLKVNGVIFKLYDDKKLLEAIDNYAKTLIRLAIVSGEYKYGNLKKGSVVSWLTSSISLSV